MILMSGEITPDLTQWLWPVSPNKNFLSLIRQSLLLLSSEEESKYAPSAE